jgi:hypothetical protein
MKFTKYIKLMSLLVVHVCLVFIKEKCAFLGSIRLPTGPTKRLRQLAGLRRTHEFDRLGIPMKRES